MVDLVDRAREEEEVHRAASLARLRTAGAVAYPAAPAGQDCIDCGDPVGAERLAALPQARRCVRCQEGFERRGRGER